MKVCYSCKTEKDYQDFGKNKTTSDGYCYYCKSCSQVRDKARYLQNKEKRKLQMKEYYNRTKEERKESIRAYYKRYSKDNKDKIFANAAKRRAAKRQRVVSWDKDLTDFICKEAYALAKMRKQFTGFLWHVDHIIPLQGVKVCGLHIWNNLQLLPAKENLSKFNSYEVL